MLQPYDVSMMAVYNTGTDRSMLMVIRASIHAMRAWSGKVSAFPYACCRTNPQRVRPIGFARSHTATRQADTTVLSAGSDAHTATA